MQEFSSISVSSYEAGSLPDQLTEQSRDGWSVVAIVPTGSTVTAYLSRDADNGAAPVVATTPNTSDTAPTDAASGWAAGAAAPTGSDISGTAEADRHFTVADEPAAETSSTDMGASAAGAAPAGWYADPSSRFELRYWDGNQWTEHVSRAGQQYTDPPVA